MKKQIEGLRWRPRWVTHLGCVKGCLECLDVDVSWGWLFGGTGHAFVINIHDVVCPSGPTAWNTGMLGRLARNLGYRVGGMFARKRDPDFAAKQAAAWGYVRASIDRDIPCYGWELGVPEFYTIHGYDDVGYHYSGPGCDDGDGPVPWQKVGDSGIGILEIYSVHPGEPAPEEKVVKDAFTFALEHADSPNKWIFPEYRSGPEGFDRWADALERGTATRFGHGYNAAVWAECRGHAVAFLKEAGERLAGRCHSLFDDAIAKYSIVRSKLKQLSDLHPFRTPEGDAEGDKVSSAEGAALVREAAAAEREGLGVLGRITESL